MTDPDTEADRLLQVPRLITFTDNFLALYKLLLLQSYVLLLFSVGLIGG